MFFHIISYYYSYYYNNIISFCKEERNLKNKGTVEMKGMFYEIYM